MKKNLLTLILSFICLVSSAQIKMHATGHVSFQSTTYVGGVQIDTLGKSSFEPLVTQSYTNLTQTAVRSQLVRAWTVHYAGSSFLVPVDRFYVTGVGDVYSNGY